MVLFVLAALPFFWGPVAGSVSAQGPLTLDAYRAAVDRTIVLVDEALAVPAADRRQALLQQAADTLDGVRELQLANGKQLPVDHAALSATLRDKSAGPAALKAARARLAALSDALSQPAAAVDAGDQAKLRDLLAQPPFTADQSQSWLAQWLDELLGRLLGGAAQGILDGRYVIVALGLLLVAGVLVYFALNLRRHVVAEAALPAALAGDETDLTSSVALGNARRLAVAGDYRSAVRQLYLSTLLLLDERGRLRYDRSLTNREYLRALAARPPLREALRPIVDTFDRIWYGFAPMTAGEFEQYRMQVETLQKL